MGYRSNVRIVTSRKGYDELSKFIDKYLKKNKLDNSYNLLNRTNVNYISENYCYFGWDWIKWYEDDDDYLDVIGITKGLQHLRKLDFSYRYSRMGESYDDFEVSDYNSKKENEKYLEYPTVYRCFDDEYVLSLMEKNLRNEKDI